MKKGFTLIEVMIATVIVLIASFAILSMSSNSKYLFNLITQNNDFTLKASVVAIEQKKGNLYENLKNFNITNDYIIHILKKYKFHFKKDIDVQEFKDFNITKETDILNIYNSHNQMQIYEVKIK